MAVQSMTILSARETLKHVSWHANADWSVLNPSSSWPRHLRSLLYRKNDLSAGKPSLFRMAADVLIHPMYLIQVHMLPSSCLHNDIQQLYE